MTESSALTYNLLVIKALCLSRSMKVLDRESKQLSEPPYIDDYFEGFQALSEELLAVGTVLQMLRDTPNAYINPEAMERLRSAVDFAAKIEEMNWAKEMLKTDSLLD